MSQKIYDEKTAQLIKNDALQSRNGDFIVFGSYEEVNDKFTRVPAGMELYFLSSDEYNVSESLIKQLKKESTIGTLGYYQEDKWIKVTPKVYREGDMVPNHIMEVFPRGMISQVGSFHTQGISKEMRLSRLWIHMQSANNTNKIIRCFWTANKLTNPILTPELIFYTQES